MGEKLTLIVGSSTYVLYLSLFLYPNNPCLYIYSVIIGVGAAILWTAQGSLMVKYSTRETMDRNATIFWALFQVSLIEPHRHEPPWGSNHYLGRTYLRIEPLKFLCLVKFDNWSIIRILFVARKNRNNWSWQNITLFTVDCICWFRRLCIFNFKKANSVK